MTCAACEPRRQCGFGLDTCLGAVVPQGAQEEAEWSETFAQYKTKYPEEAAEFETIVSGELPSGWEKALPTFTPEDKARLALHDWRCHHNSGLQRPIQPPGC